MENLIEIQTAHGSDSATDGSESSPSTDQKQPDPVPAKPKPKPKAKTKVAAGWNVQPNTQGQKTSPLSRAGTAAGIIGRNFTAKGGVTEKNFTAAYKSCGSDGYKWPGGVEQWAHRRNNADNEASGTSNVVETKRGAKDGKLQAVRITSG